MRKTTRADRDDTISSLRANVYPNGISKVAAIARARLQFAVEDFLSWWHIVRIVGALVLLLGVAGITPGPLYLLSRRSRFLIYANELHLKISPGLIVSGIGILGVDAVRERLSQAAKTRELFQSLRSADPVTAQRAFEEIKTCRWLADGHLAGRNLSNVNLRGADFATVSVDELPGGGWMQRQTPPDLEGTILAFSHLESALLTCARLRYARLDNTDLRGANLAAAELHGADLANSDLEGADLRGASLQGACLEGSNLLNAKVEKPYPDLSPSTILPDGATANADSDLVRFTNRELAGFWESPILTRKVRGSPDPIWR